MNSILISKNTEISLTSNLWTKKGLVNGAQSTVKEIIYPAYKTNNSLIIVSKVRQIPIIVHWRVLSILVVVERSLELTGARVIGANAV